MQNGGVVVGVVHTHPMSGMTWANNGRCDNAPADSVLSMSGVPSPEDLDLIGVIRNYLETNIDAYVINTDNVTVYTGRWDGTGEQDKRNPPVEVRHDPPILRNTTCLID